MHLVAPSVLPVRTPKTTVPAQTKSPAPALAGRDSVAGDTFVRQKATGPKFGANDRYKIPSSEDEKALITAVRTGDNRELARLLEARVDPNVGDRRENDRYNSLTRTGKIPGTALSLATRAGNCQAMRLLLEHGAHADECPYEFSSFYELGDTPMNIAIQSRQANAVATLLSHGVSPNEGGKEHSYFHRVVDSRPTPEINHIIALMLAHGADPNEPYRYNRSMHPLNLAARQNNVDAVRLLLAHGSNLQGSEGGLTDLHTAAYEGHTTMIEELLANRMNLNVRNSNSSSALHLAAANGQRDAMELLIKKGLDVNDVNRAQETPLHEAACSDDPLSTITALLRAGANTNLQTRHGSTPLHRLVTNTSNIPAAQALLDHGADLTLQDEDDRTPLDAARHWVTSIRESRRGTPQQFVEAQAMIHFLEQAAEQPQGVRYRVSHTAGPNQPRRQVNARQAQIDGDASLARRLQAVLDAEEAFPRAGTSQPASPFASIQNARSRSASRFVRQAQLDEDAAYAARLQQEEEDVQLAAYAARLKQEEEDVQLAALLQAEDNGGDTELAHTVEATHLNEPATSPQPPEPEEVRQFNQYLSTEAGQEAQERFEDSLVSQMMIYSDALNPSTRQQIQDLRMLLANPDVPVAGVFVKSREQGGQTEITFQFEDPETLPGALADRYPMGTLQLFLPTDLIEDGISSREELQGLLGLALPEGASYLFQ